MISFLFDMLQNGYSCKGTAAESTWFRQIALLRISCFVSLFLSCFLFSSGLKICFWVEFRVCRFFF
uniref:Uncharacterized protein n=1 Tax=Rhizophora mucronata TaxID=61149 RepID=A0A2P2PNE9_RHIMU